MQVDVSQPRTPKKSLKGWWPRVNVLGPCSAQSESTHVLTKCADLTSTFSTDNTELEKLSWLN